MSLNLASLVANSYRYFANEPALIDGPRRMSYREVAGPSRLSRRTCEGSGSGAAIAWP
jgi:hypothetical protein